MIERRNEHEPPIPASFPAGGHRARYPPEPRGNSIGDDGSGAVLGDRSEERNVVQPPL